MLKPILLCPVASSQAEALVPILRDADEDEVRIRTTLANEAYTSYLALGDEKRVGAATVLWQSHESELVYIAVLPGMRGQGYGTAIMHALIEEMRRRGVRSLLVGTGNSSIDAIVFYQRCGFRMDSVRRDYFSYVQPPVSENGIPLRDMLVLRYEV